MTAIFNQDDVPGHLLNSPELDFSKDLFADRLTWVRLGPGASNIVATSWAVALNRISVKPPDGKSRRCSSVKFSSFQAAEPQHFPTSFPAFLGTFQAFQTLTSLPRSIYFHPTLDRGVPIHDFWHQTMYTRDIHRSRLKRYENARRRGSGSKHSKTAEK